MSDMPNKPTLNERFNSGVEEQMDIRAKDEYEREIFWIKGSLLDVLYPKPALDKDNADLFRNHDARRDHAEKTILLPFEVNYINTDGIYRIAGDFSSLSDEAIQSLRKMYSRFFTVEEKLWGWDLKVK